MFEGLTSMLSAGVRTSSGPRAAGGPEASADVDAAMNRVEALLDDALGDPDRRDALASAIRDEIEPLVTRERMAAES